MYTIKNYKTKKELKTDLEAGKQIEVYQPNEMFGNAPKNGRVTLEGPHYPQPHKWYASCIIKDGYIVPGTLK